MKWSFSLFGGRNIELKLPQIVCGPLTGGVLVLTHRVGVDTLTVGPGGTLAGHDDRLKMTLNRFFTVS